MKSKPLEGKPTTFGQKSVTANANASAMAVHGKGDQRPFFGMSMEETAYH